MANQEADDLDVQTGNVTDEILPNDHKNHTTTCNVRV